MTEGKVHAVCVSSSKGEQKRAVDRVLAVANHGLEDDAHAGGWHRQVSLLSVADIDTMRTRGLDLKPGDFGENIVLQGVDLGTLGIGSRLGLAEVELEITQVGKTCHSRCAIFHQAGDCIMPRDGLFARVVQGGELRPGAPARVLRVVPRSAVQAAVVTVSDSVAAGRATDTAGPAVEELLADAGQAHIAWTGVVADDQEGIAERLVDLADRGLDLVVTAGGTGCAARDRTPEATLSVIEREVPGLAEAMRTASAEITRHAWLQRGVCGIRGSTLIINLPGSRKAAVENLEAVLPVLGHAVELLRGHTKHDDERTLPVQGP
jgi:molybdenum cofactor synthesis domain-containing protein